MLPYDGHHGFFASLRMDRKWNGVKAGIKPGLTLLLVGPAPCKAFAAVRSWLWPHHDRRCHIGAIVFDLATIGLRGQIDALGGLAMVLVDAADAARRNLLAVRLDEIAAGDSHFV